MPYQDGTGPVGRGRQSGSGLGPCGLGLRRGLGLRWLKSNKDGREDLEDYEKNLEAELKAVREEKKALKGQKQ